MTVALGSSGAEIKPFKAGLWTCLPRQDGGNRQQIPWWKQFALSGDRTLAKALVSCKSGAKSETVAALMPHKSYGESAIIAIVSISGTQRLPALTGYCALLISSS
jgi:hypothetical protein